MTSFFRLAFLISFFVQIFAVNSQDTFAYKLQSIDEKFDIFKNESQTQANEMKEQFKILIDQIQIQKKQFEKFLKEQAEASEQTNRKLAEKLGNVEEILLELTKQGKEKQQEIESLQEKLKAKQLISVNLNENLELVLLRSSNISEQLQICNQNSTEIIQELKIKKLKLEERLLQPCEFFLNQANTDQGIFKINLNESGLEPFDVNCERIDEEAWLIIQRRQDGSENFYRNWTDYKNGFGDLDGEFWLGLEKLHQLTKNHEWELKIWLRKEEKEGFARYKKFKVGNETEQYKLTVGEFSGNVEDYMEYNNGQKFSTPDRDNDEWPEVSCATTIKGAWWFENCGVVNLNGDFDGKDEPYHYGMYWDHFGDNLKYSQMTIRRLK